jgi:hypothetical protein
MYGSLQTEKKTSLKQGIDLTCEKYVVLHLCSCFRMRSAMMHLDPWQVRSHKNSFGEYFAGDRTLGDISTEVPPQLLYLYMYCLRTVARIEPSRLKHQHR